MIIKTIGKHDFHDAFCKAGRGEQFSYEALEALYDYYDNLSDGTGEPYELDVIAICCEWTEYDSLQEAYSEYYGDDSDLPKEQRRTQPDQQLEYFEDNTQVIELEDSNSVLIMNF